MDVTFELAGGAITTEQAIMLTKRRGRVMLIAHYGKRAEVDPEEELPAPPLQENAPGKKPLIWRTGRAR